MSPPTLTTHLYYGKVNQFNSIWSIGQKDMNRKINILIGNLDDGLTDVLSKLIKDLIKDKYDLKIRSSRYNDDLAQLSESCAVDIFILILNNIKFIDNLSYAMRMASSLNLITYFKKTYGKPVIALSDWLEGSPFVEMAKRSADYYFSLPCEYDAFKEAIQKCLDKIGGS